jgi:hypothetical protein
MIRGVPFSDARSWHAMATDFARGERWDGSWLGWSARRPFYWILLGSIFSWTGTSFVVARWVQLVLGALGTGVVFDLVRRLAGARLAIVVALSHALGLTDAALALTTLTEPFGNFFSDVSVWAFVLGIERLAGERPGARPLLASGILCGVSNLTRTLTIGAPFGEPLAAALVLKPRLATEHPSRDTHEVRGGEVRARRAEGSEATPLAWRRLVPLGGVVVGFLLALAPWIVRQKVVHGITTISENTADALFAATTPEFGGTWSGDVSALASSLPVKERVAFYMEGTKRHLHEHLGWYLGNVLRQSGLAIESFARPRWLLLVAIGLGLALGLAPGLERPGRREARLLLVAGGLAIFVAVPISPVSLLAVGGLGLALARRHPLALLAGLVLPTILLLGISAQGNYPRITHTLDSSCFALAAYLVQELLVRAAGEPLDPGPLPRPVPGWGRAARLVRAVALGLGLVLLGGLGRAVARNLAAPAGPAPNAIVPADEARPWIERALEGDVGQRYASLRDRLVVCRAPWSPGYVRRFAAGERAASDSPLFAPRPYAYTVLETRPAVPNFNAVFPGDPGPLESGDELVLVGVPVVGPHEGWFEVIALGRGERLLRASEETAGRQARDLASRAGR